jgi:hypothetical protein
MACFKRVRRGYLETRLRHGTSTLDVEFPQAEFESFRHELYTSYFAEGRKE